jgi:hypothetical protein
VPDNVREGTRAGMGGIVRRKVPQKIYRLVVVVNPLWIGGFRTTAR